MNRTRTVTAASGISAVLVAGSTAFAFANGMFVAQPAAPVASIGVTRARLVPTPALRATHVPFAPVRPLAAVPPRGAPVVAYVATTAPPAFAAPVTIPVATSAPVVARSSSATIARSGPSAVSGRHSGDGHETREHDRRDD